ncbi:MAG: Flp family type IVb pilin [Chloroflexota bacterium]|jgi:Flp pilus assembly pilin Flp|nr:Flp family type IVb pilin [Chloroflexota bacterium]
MTAAARRIVGERRGATSSGQGIVEYGLILALTSALTLVWLFVFGGAIAEALTLIGEAIDRAAGG